ncbi:hypothetical protein GF366_02490 [Candidatus Peregrinibacteria bacterium]|nr:hypothetical protein [Candidatus Peregrinibacteria bacterium]
MKKIILLLIIFLSLSSHIFADDSEEYEEVIMGGLYMEAEFLDGDILKVTVMAEEMLAPVLGIAFHLNYDENLAFLKYEPGEFLERGGDPFYLVQNNEESLKLIFGETLRRNDDFPLGEGLIVDFYFQILEESEFIFIFENGVVSTLNVVRQDLDKILWEDLTIGRDNEKEVIFSSKSTKNSVLNVQSDSDSSFIVPAFLIAMAFITGFVIVFFLRKQEKKRQDASVNYN